MDAPTEGEVGQNVIARLKHEVDGGEDHCEPDVKRPRLEEASSETQRQTDSTIQPDPNKDVDSKGVIENQAGGDTVESEDLTASSNSKLLDPLSYTKTDEFTSEIFKVQIHNLPKFGFSDLKKRLKSHLKLNPNKIKSPSGHHVAYVCFRNKEDRDAALEKISGHVWKGYTLSAKIAAPVADPYLQRRQQTDDRNTTSDPDGHLQTLREGPVMTSEEAEAKLKYSVTPLWDVPYPQQLEKKVERVKSVLKKVRTDRTVNFMFSHKSQADGLPCELLPIIPSPVTKEYRNKNEFTVGFDLDGKTVKVGFRYGLYKNGITAVGDCHCVDVVMPAAVPVVKSFCDFVSKSRWPPFRQQTGTGHWQTLTVRTQTTGDIMVMADFVPRKLEQAEIEEAKKSLKEFYTSGEGKDVDIKSLYFRLINGKGKESGKTVDHLQGEPHVYESLMQLKFRISPEAFFQVNTLATEKLYELIADWSCVSSSTTVLDVCCGTGTIGLSIAKRVKEVVGIEMCRQAVEDAKANASLNGITNTSFHCAKVEDVISSVLSPFESSSSANDVVAIVDPPRAGLHKNVIKRLRSCEQIQTLIYVSCSPENAMQNFIDLIRPETGRHKGGPYHMMKATPVDLFPGTNHVELVIHFSRARVKRPASTPDPVASTVGEDVGSSTTEADEPPSHVVG